MDISTTFKPTFKQNNCHLNQISNLKKSIKLGAKCSPLKLLLTRCKKTK